jgi:hypothetical protein
MLVRMTVAHDLVEFSVTVVVCSAQMRDKTAARD